MGVFGHGLWCCPSSVRCLWCLWLGFAFGLLMGRVWFRARPACPPPFPVPACGVGVRAGPGSRLCPALLGWVVAVCFLRFCPCFFCWVSLSGALCSLSPHPFSFGLGCWLFFFLFRGVCLHVSVSLFAVGRCSWLGVAGLACWSPCASFAVLSLVPSGRGAWPPLVVLAGGLVAVGCFRAPTPPPSVFFSGGGGGLPVPPSAFPGLVHALARIQCCLPGCCWRLRSVWPCSGPMGQVGYVNGGLGAPSCRVRSWLCRLGGCLWLWVRGLGLFVSFPLCGAGFNLLGGPPTLLPGALWPRVWPAVLVCGVLVRRLPECAVACSGESFRLGSVVSCCAALCRAAPRRVVLWRVALWRAVVRCAVVSRCAVVGQWESAWPVSWCGVRAGVWLAGGWGVRLGGGVSLRPCCGGLGVPLGLVVRVGRARDGPWGCPPWGPVPWSRVLWGFRSLVLVAVAVPSSSFGAYEVALVAAGVVAWR